jgi:hypothetical protein
MTDAVASAEAPSAAAPESGAAAPDDAPRSARELVLDHLTDTVEAGPQSIAQIVEGTGIDRNTIDQVLLRATRAEEIEHVGRGLYKLAAPKPPAPPKQAVEKAAAPPPLAVAEADVELFRSLLMATGGHVVTAQPRGTGVTDLTTVKAMIANGADLEADILPTIRNHVGELAQRPLESWTAQWFVQGVAESHRRRLEAAAKPAAPAAPAKPSVPAIDDAELLEKLLTAGEGNFGTGPGIRDLRPIRIMLADGVELDDILRALRDKVSRRASAYATTLLSWSEPRFFRMVAESQVRRTVVPGWVGRWTKTLHGEPAETPGPPAAVSAPPTSHPPQRRPAMRSRRAFEWVSSVLSPVASFMVPRDGQGSLHQSKQVRQAYPQPLLDRGPWPPPHNRHGCPSGGSPTDRAPDAAR